MLRDLPLVSIPVELCFEEVLDEGRESMVTCREVRPLDLEDVRLEDPPEVPGPCEMRNGPPFDVADPLLNLHEELNEVP